MQKMICKWGIPEKSFQNRGPRGRDFPIHLDSRQCREILSALDGKDLFCCPTECIGKSYPQYP